MSARTVEISSIHAKEIIINLSDKSGVARPAVRTASTITRSNAQSAQRSVPSILWASPTVSLFRPPAIAGLDFSRTQ